MNSETPNTPHASPKSECPACPETERIQARKVFVPAVDIIETKEALLLVSEMPGVDDSGVDVTIEKNVLTIKGTVADQLPAGFQLSHEEYGVGDYERSFTLPNEIDREGVQALIKNGLLKITLPKNRQQASRKVSVKAG